MSEDFRQPFLQVAATAWAGDAGADPSRALGKRPDPGAQGGASAFSWGPSSAVAPGTVLSPLLVSEDRKENHSFCDCAWQLPSVLTGGLLQKWGCYI